MSFFIVIFIWFKEERMRWGGKLVELSLFYNLNDVTQISRSPLFDDFKQLALLCLV